ncbi:MmcQ/YjbR family DNA-binding protein [Psychroflexus aestuariivivens]|uniref:MmcQ/YjbR family DNA-binding protein n=1 Tax=Psychroflexus aestuariivivens TaxID=1795040 RepID=UPI000FD97CA7|nr:MmcQ/YjbR family DNA-binding protein [Psychroflexus aestuariivivens]
MNIEELRDYCLAKSSTSEGFPFGEDVLVFKVCGKMFALISLKKWENGSQNINLKCDPDYAIELRTEYPDEVFPGYHMDKKHWNTVVINGSNLSEKQIKHLINHSYELVVSKLPKKDRIQLES